MTAPKGSVPVVPERWREDYHDPKHFRLIPCIEELGAAESLIRELARALKAFEEAFKEPDGGDYRPLRRLAESYGIYEEDLGPNRVLLHIVKSMLSRIPKELL